MATVPTPVFARRTSSVGVLACWPGRGPPVTSWQELRNEARDDGLARRAELGLLLLLQQGIAELEQVRTGQHGQGVDGEPGRPRQVDVARLVRGAGLRGRAHPRTYRVGK